MRPDCLPADGSRDGRRVDDETLQKTSGSVDWIVYDEPEVVTIDVDRRAGQSLWTCGAYCSVCPFAIKTVTCAIHR